MFGKAHYGTLICRALPLELLNSKWSSILKCIDEQFRHHRLPQGNLQRQSVISLGFNVSVVTGILISYFRHMVLSDFTKRLHVCRCVADSCFQYGNASISGLSNCTSLWLRARVRQEESLNAMGMLFRNKED